MGSRTVRGALCAAAAALLLLSSLAARPTTAATVPDQPDLATLRVRLRTSSDWTSVDLEQVTVRARHLRSSSGVERAWTRERGWSVVTGGSDAEHVVDLVVEVAPGDLPRVVVSKGRVGTATVEVLRVAGDGSLAAVNTVTLDGDDPDGQTAVGALDRDTLLAGGVQVPSVDPRPLTLAFYYPWFDEDAADDRRIAPDRPGSWYATSDRAHVEGMVSEASGAGIDGFLVSWEGGLHGDVVDLLVDAVAARPGFTLAPTLELPAFSQRTLFGARFDPSSAAVAVRDFLQRVPAGHRLEVDGRPVVVLFGMWDLQPADWEQLTAVLADIDPFFIGDRLDPGFGVDGHYRYDPNPLSVSELDTAYQRALDRTHLQSMVDPSVRPTLWAATVSPGYDNRGSKLVFGRRSTDRADGWRYDETWRVALRSAPEWVFVTSWNEWFEQTHVSPGRSTGRTALDQTARWSELFTYASA